MGFFFQPTCVKGAVIRSSGLLTINIIKMNITLAKVKRTLEKDYGWSNMNIESQKFLIDELIKDTLKIIDNELRTHKGISIKKR